MVVSWLYLANSYESVAHNLIQHALEWYHASASMCELIYHYYDKMFVRIRKPFDADSRISSRC